MNHDWLNNFWGLKENPFHIKPLSSREEIVGNFVNRDEEVELLTNILSTTMTGISCGISGKRGSGKSTVLYKILSDIEEEGYGFTIVVNASGELNRLEFLEMILFNICKRMKDIEISDDLKEEIARIFGNIIYENEKEQGTVERTTLGRSIRAGIASIFGAEVSDTKTDEIEDRITKRVKPYGPTTLIEEITQILQKIRSELTDKIIVIGIDETDKLTFKNSLALLQHIKPIINLEYCHLVFVGTEHFYINFYRAFTENGLEDAETISIFQNMCIIFPFDYQKDLDNLNEIIRKRIDFYEVKKGKGIIPFTNESIGIVFEMTRGLPKQLMQVCSDIFMTHGRKCEIIGPDLVTQYFRNRNVFPEISPKEIDFLKIALKLKSIKLASKAFRSIVKQRGLEEKSETNYYNIYKGLFDKGYLIRDPPSGRLKKYTPKIFCQYLGL